MSAYDYSAFLAEYPWFQAFIDAGNDPNTVSTAPDGAESFASEVQKVVGTNVEAMLFSGVSPEETASKLQKELAALVASKKKDWRPSWFDPVLYRVGPCR
ncbi:hypothetical protein QN224_33215 [Sinorhizobium sp. 8-89]|uniref:hypothetical protein n=1 Tax=Sinorhizobium sp. 7-81 TaxID=3049087 RepID=UPI0024C2C998|nr:hypothetical protein [Sinorhizobium sp. 7-81]MDK1390140.1 hypothetical protein [Sinorhizobium sp. 7-81]